MNDSLNNIPDGFLNHMKKTCDVDMTKYKNPLDAVRDAVKAKQEEAKKLAAEQPQQPVQIPAINIDGYTLPADAMTMLVYTITVLAQKNKDVKKVLDTFGFQFPDLNKKTIYPRKNAKRSRKHSK